MTTTPAPAASPMSAEQSAVLAEFARACRAAARSVSLYPATHPAIQTSLSRVMAAAERLIPSGDLLLTVLPDTLGIDGRSPAKPDPAIVELAELMHDRLVGTVRIERAAGVQDWHALLLLLARPADELIAEGGIARAWAEAGRAHFELREIDYAEVLRERAGRDASQWDAIIAYCLQGSAGPLDERALAALIDTLGDAGRFAELLGRFQSAAAAGEVPMGARAAAFLHLVEELLKATAERPKAQGEDAVLQTAADAMSRVTPDMLLAVIRHTLSPEPAQAQLATAVVNRIKDETIASFVAGSVVNERGASERLAQAFEALVPELDRKERLLDLAKEEAAESPLGREPGFEDLWQSAHHMLTSYSDERYVSAEYARELSSARTQAIDVERTSDDPPERIQGWLGTVSNQAVRDLDVQLLLDLLAIEQETAPWGEVARLVTAEIDRRVQAGRMEDAQQLTSALVRETSPEGHEPIRHAAESALDALVAGPFSRHLVARLRAVEDPDVEPVTGLCRTIGPRIIKPLAQALAAEENVRTIRRLRELLFGFGAAGRESVEQLKLSANPAVRRTAIELLRMFGGEEALAELSTMLGDRDPQVQREAIRAIIQRGSPEAFALLQRALVAGGARTTVLQEVIGLRDERVVPLLCAVLTGSMPRGALVEIHAQVMDALGGLGSHAESTRALREALYRGKWWAPFRTAALRGAAAAALRRIGTPETVAILEEAARHGSRGVRKAVRPYLRVPPQRERQHA
ncbi:MAG: HEAT repeat domain-containing protein [Acidobacteria bacterium]|nr:HEAT repeat domain-containing protein [Acidobacteriota bacterium]